MPIRTAGTVRCRGSGTARPRFSLAGLSERRTGLLLFVRGRRRGLVTARGRESDGRRAPFQSVLVLSYYLKSPVLPIASLSPPRDHRWRHVEAGGISMCHWQDRGGSHRWRLFPVELSRRQGGPSCSEHGLTSGPRRAPPERVATCPASGATWSVPT